MGQEAILQMQLDPNLDFLKDSQVSAIKIEHERVQMELRSRDMNHFGSRNGTSSSAR